MTFSVSCSGIVYVIIWYSMSNLNKCTTDGIMAPQPLSFQSRVEHSSLTLSLVFKINNKFRHFYTKFLSPSNMSKFRVVTKYHFRVFPQILPQNILGGIPQKVICVVMSSMFCYQCIMRKSAKRISAVMSSMFRN